MLLPLIGGLAASEASSQTLAPAAIGAEGKLELVSLIGAPASGTTHGAIAGRHLPVAESTIPTPTISLDSGGGLPNIRWTSGVEGTGCTFQIYRAISFAGGWIVGDLIATSTGTGSGSSYLVSDPTPYQYGDPARTYILEVGEPSVPGSSLSPAVTFQQATAPSRDTWSIF
jgi:hypothetical protein